MAFPITGFMRNFSLKNPPAPRAPLESKTLSAMSDELKRLHRSENSEVCIYVASLLRPTLRQIRVIAIPRGRTLAWDLSNFGVVHFPRFGDTHFVQVSDILRKIPKK